MSRLLDDVERMFFCVIPAAETHLDQREPRHTVVTIKVDLVLLRELDRLRQVTLRFLQPEEFARR